MRSLVVRRESIESRDALLLIAELNAELSHRYPEPDANHFRLESNDVAPGNGAFVIARTERTPIGCGAIRRIDLGDHIPTAEIKRMFVVPKLRGQGVGFAILQKLEQLGGALGVRRLLLETGERQPEALALYRRCGFERRDAFGEYIHSPLSVCMSKELAKQ